ncbi:MAG: hypothetical protein M3093_05250 [Thermoproteota archaeon]|nr:hypothetical protein [Thermoproteota archaeon]
MTNNRLEMKFENDIHIHTFIITVESVNGQLEDLFDKQKIFGPLLYGRMVIWFESAECQAYKHAERILSSHRNLRLLQLTI